MQDNPVNITLIKKLIDCGAVKLNRSIDYRGFVVNEFYLDSEDKFLEYCVNYAFKNRYQTKEKRKVALLLATLILNKKDIQ